MGRDAIEAKHFGAITSGQRLEPRHEIGDVSTVIAKRVVLVDQELNPPPERPHGRPRQDGHRTTVAERVDETVKIDCAFAKYLRESITVGPVEEVHVA